MKRRPLVEQPERWHARTDARGQWVVVNEKEEPVMTHPDPEVRLHAVWLASRAPELQWALKRLAERCDRFLRDHGYQRFRDNEYVFIAMGVVGDTLPPWEEVMRARGSGQLEIDFTEHDAA